MKQKVKKKKEKNAILIIVGPTASGKSSLAVRLAKKINGEIISADSRQVYRGLNIGTGKITKREMDGVPHYLLDVADPEKQFTASDFVRLARQAIEHIRKRKKLPIIVGGTGFYIDALVGKIFLPPVPPNQSLRQKLEKKTTEELFKLLKQKDARRARTIDRHNKIRLIRALEIVEKIGEVPPPVKINGLNSRLIFIGLKPSDLEERIYKRLIERFEGMIEEGKKLHKKGLSYKRMFELGLEYRYIAMFLKGEIKKSEMLAELFNKIRQYSKRQMTWFKHNKKIKWFKSDETDKIEKYVLQSIV